MYKPLSLQWTRLQVTHHTYTGITWFVVDLSDRAKLCSQSPETMGLCWYKVVEFDFKSVSRNTRQKTTGLCRHMSLIRYYLHMEIILVTEENLLLSPERPILCLSNQMLSISLKTTMVTFAAREENHGRVSSGKRQCVQPPFFPLTVSAFQIPHHRDIWHQYHHTCLQLATSCFWLHAPPLTEYSCPITFYPVDSAPIWVLSRQLLQENVLGNYVKGLTKIHITPTASSSSTDHLAIEGWSRGAAFHKAAWWPHCPACTRGWHSGWSAPWYSSVPRSGK